MNEKDAEIADPGMETSEIDSRKYSEARNAAPDVSVAQHAFGFSIANPRSR